MNQPMNRPTDVAVQPVTQSIIVDEVFPHAPAVLWRAMTSGELMSRWLMEPTGFAPVPGTAFTFKTRPAGEWDGLIRCEVLEVVPEQLLSYAWRGGHESNDGYGSKLETVVSFTLFPTEAGTRLRVVHSGFLLPQNHVAYTNMSDGWKTVVKRLDTLVAEEAGAPELH